MIPFNKPPVTGDELNYISQAIQSPKLSGDGEFSQQCHQWFEKNLPCSKALLTPSCTHSLEMAAILLNLSAEDEVIMPSYTFVSTANAFALRGAKIKFVDIRPDTLNIDESQIEQAITPKTKAIVVVHYAGVSCEMDTIMDIAKKYNLTVIEDAAQGMMSTYKGKALGTIGHIGAYSFHETKNYTSGGEGGLIILNDKRFIERAEIIREKGTNRSQFFRGAVDKYSWVDIGSSYLLNDLSAAFLLAQLHKAEDINKNRLSSWFKYQDALTPLANKGLIELPHIPKDCEFNAHMFYIKLKNLEQRSQLIAHLNEQNIKAIFHYVPLHSSAAGQSLGVFVGDDTYTTTESNRLLRLPLYYGLTSNEIAQVCASIAAFFN